MAFVGKLSLAAVLLVFLAACQSEIDIFIKAYEDGTGSVELTTSIDEVTLDSQPGLLNRLDLEDLSQAGWQLSQDSPAVRRGTKPFQSPNQIQDILNEIGGSGFSDFELKNTAPKGGRSFSLTGKWNVHEFMKNFLGGSSIDLETLPAGSIKVNLTIDLNDGAATQTWSVDNTETGVLNVHIEDSRENSTNQTLTWVGITALGLLGLSLLFTMADKISEKRTERRKKEGGINKSSGAGKRRKPKTKETFKSEKGKVREKTPAPELLILNVRNVLISEDREQQDVIQDFLERLQKRGIKIAGWARDPDDLPDSIKDEMSVLQSSKGPSPSKALIQNILEKSGVDPEKCIVIDSDETSLNTAKDMGADTLQITNAPSKHSSVFSLADLLED